MSPIVRERYPEDWEEISRRIRFERAGGKCEGCLMYPECRAEHGKPHPATGKIVFLQCAHWPDPDPAKSDDDNLHAWCQRCHNTMDGLMRVDSRRRHIRERQKRAGQLEFVFKRGRRGHGGGKADRHWQ